MRIPFVLALACAALWLGACADARAGLFDGAGHHHHHHQAAYYQPAGVGLSGVQYTTNRIPTTVNSSLVAPYGQCAGCQPATAVAATTSVASPVVVQPQSVVVQPQAVVAAPQACPTPCPQVCPTPCATECPQTCFRTTWVRVPVTSYSPVVSTDPCTGCQVTALRPCTSYTWQAQKVPVTAYRPFTGWFSWLHRTRTAYSVVAEPGCGCAATPATVFTPSATVVAPSAVSVPAATVVAPTTTVAPSAVVTPQYGVQQQIGVQPQLGVQQPGALQPASPQAQPSGGQQGQPEPADMQPRLRPGEGGSVLSPPTTPPQGYNGTPSQGYNGQPSQGYNGSNTGGAAPSSYGTQGSSSGSVAPGTGPLAPTNSGYNSGYNMGGARPSYGTPGTSTGWSSESAQPALAPPQSGGLPRGMKLLPDPDAEIGSGRASQAPPLLNPDDKTAQRSVAQPSTYMPVAWSAPSRETPAPSVNEQPFHRPLRGRVINGGLAHQAKPEVVAQKSEMTARPSAGASQWDDSGWRSSP
jgi:hypothetical protein